MKAIHSTLLTICLAAILPCSAEEPKAPGKLVTIEGVDAPFAKFIESGAIKTGERFSKGPVHGSLVRVNHELLEKQTGKAGSIPQKIGLHTQGSGGIKRKDFAKWTRWYQEDGKVQIFRLFAGEQSARDGLGAEGKPGRVEVFTGHKVSPREWSEWEGTYTIVEPIAKGSYKPAVDNQISFRWGMYCGSKKGRSISKNAMLLVSDVVVREN